MVEELESVNRTAGVKKIISYFNEKTASIEIFNTNKEI